MDERLERFLRSWYNGFKSGGYSVFHPFEGMRTSRYLFTFNHTSCYEIQQNQYRFKFQLHAYPLPFIC